MRRAFLIVLDSVGIGEAPDADAYGDIGANTLAHTAVSTGRLSLPCLQSLGLGNIPDTIPSGIPIAGVPPSPRPLASFGAMRERSQGKDTVTGHWEMAGLVLDPGFTRFPPGPPSFAHELVAAFASETGRPVIGNCAASGTAIIESLGERHIREGSWIVYTSADSVFQIAAHEDVIPLRKLYHACEVARRLCNPYRVGRVIARPFVGTPGAFFRTDNRRDYPFPLPEPTVFDALVAAGVPVTVVGKLDDVFNGRGFTLARHAENSPAACDATIERLANQRHGLVFTNLIDFDMRYGHRRDPAGYARALAEADAFLTRIVAGLGPDDLLVVTADHGNDPTFRGTDHTREYVPLLVYRPGTTGRTLGIRDGFFDIARSLTDWFQIGAWGRGASFVSAD